jgi:capsid protein
MTRFAVSAIAALASLCAPFAAVSTAGAADLPGGYYEYQDQSVCNQAWVLSKITHRFRHQVRHVPHLPNVEITDFQRIRLTRSLPANEEWPIGRTYCTARVTLSNGYDRNIAYLIEEGQGFASIGDNVEFCVSGFDRWMVYNGRCRVLR